MPSPITLGPRLVPYALSNLFQILSALAVFPIPVLLVLDMTMPMSNVSPVPSIVFSLGRVPSVLHVFPTPTPHPPGLQNVLIVLGPWDSLVLMESLLSIKTIGDISLSIGMSPFQILLPRGSTW